MQVPDEKFLVVINDLLASGEVPGLFADDELENVINSLRNEVKGAGIQDTKENIWKFFIDRVRRQLKVLYSLVCSDSLHLSALISARLFSVSLLLGPLLESVVGSSLLLLTAHVLTGSMSGLKRLLSLSAIVSFQMLNSLQ